MEKPIAFFARDRSWVIEGNLAVSWFSMKDPMRVVSAQADCMVGIPLASLAMFPLEELKASVIQKALAFVSAGPLEDGYYLRREVHKPGHKVLVGANIGGIAVEHLSNNIYTS